MEGLISYLWLNLVAVSAKAVTLIGECWVPSGSLGPMLYVVSGVACCSWVSGLGHDYSLGSRAVVAVNRTRVELIYNAWLQGEKC